jgi:predicted DCC family thiol-disulfide oxidoreductase YuxK
MIDRPYLIFYDAQCRICQRGRQMIERFRPNSPVRFVDSNDARAMGRYPQMNARGQMYVLDPSGRLSGGYDALAALAPILPAFGWMSGFFSLAPVRALGHRAYRWLAVNRYRLGGQASCNEGACQLNP